MVEVPESLRDDLARIVGVWVERRVQGLDGEVPQQALAVVLDRQQPLVVLDAVALDHAAHQLEAVCQHLGAADEYLSQHHRVVDDYVFVRQG